MADENKIREEIVYYAKLLDAKGLVNALEGNLSILDRETGRLYITPSGTRKSRLEPEMIAVLEHGEQVGGSLRRSSEYLLHEAALEARVDCAAALHTHAPYLTAYAYCGKAMRLRCSTTFALLFEDEVPCVPFGLPGTREIAAGIDTALEGGDLALLANHGCVSVGKTLEQAVAVLEAAEEVAKIASIAKSVGEIQEIPADAWERMMNEHKGSKRNRAALRK